MMNDKLLYKELTQKIIGALYEVHKNLGPGLTEVMYHRAVLYELGLLGLKVDTEKESIVYYKGKKLGSYKMDIVVEYKIVLEIKVVNRLEPIHIAQLLSYLKTTKYKVGLLVNFGKENLEFKRFIYNNNHQ